MPALLLTAALLLLSRPAAIAAQNTSLPDDVTGEVVISSGVLQGATSIVCFEKLVLPARPGRMVVAAEAVVSNPAVTGILVYGCPESPFLRTFAGATVCSDKSRVLGSNARAQCNTLFYSWGPRVERLVFPAGVGLPLDASNAVVVMEVVTDTAVSALGDGDASVTLHYTDTPRRTRAGTMPLGDPLHEFEGGVVRSIRNPFLCHAECTRGWNATVNVFAVHAHAGPRGTALSVRVGDPGGANLAELMKAEPWNASRQSYIVLDPPARIPPGKEVVTACTADGSGGGSFGRLARDEQCIAYAHFWPAQERAPGDGTLFYCGIAYQPDGSPGALCGPGWRARSRLPLDGDGAPCFPGDAVVRTRGRGMQAMRKLRVGDEVLVGPGAYSPVFMFSHRDAGARARFVAIYAADADAPPLRVTPGHLLYVNERLAPAGSVRAGDELADAAGIPVKVVRVERVAGDGLYNPQTLHGDIVVDGFRASTYTGAVPPGAAHALLAPLRGALRKLAPAVSSALDGPSRLRSYGLSVLRPLLPPMECLQA